MAIPTTYEGAPLRAQWTYRAPGGEPLGVVARYDAPDGKKDVVPFFKPNGSGWKAGGPPEPKPLFGLDTLSANPEAPCFVVEGEKCAAALHCLGLVAVTAMGGANAAHKADWAPLSGRTRALLLADNDTPGAAYAEAVAGCLGALERPPEALLVDLPGLPPAGDVVDWLQARCTGWDGFAPIPEGARAGLVAALGALAEQARPVPPEWREPAPSAPAAPLVPLSHFEAPRLSPALLPGPLGRFADALAQHTETPVELAAAMVLTAMAAAAQKRYSIMVEPGYFEPLNLWLICALPPGNRKSAIVEAAIGPLLEWERAQAERLAPAILEAEQRRKVAESEAETLRKKAAKTKDGFEKSRIMGELAALLEGMPDVPRAPQLVTSDCTPERLGALLADNNERLAWASSEGGIFDILAGRYSGGIPNLDLMLKAHAGDFERVDRGGRPPAYLRNPALTVGLAPQPEVLRGLAHRPGFRGRGLLGRFLYLLPASPLGWRTFQRFPIPAEVQAEYARTLSAVLERPEADSPRVLRLAADAYADWRAFEIEVEAGMRPGGRFEHATDWASKLTGAAARLAGVFHVAQHAGRYPEEEAVSPDTMAAALEVAAVLSLHALAAFDLMGADPATEAARQIWAWVERVRTPQFSARECWQGVKGRFARMAEVTEGLAVLAERGYVDEERPQPRAGPGRPAGPLYAVREELARGWA
ncbi:MAG: DUF3987 domain-containing protein [Chromatiaceae bacterium]|jgi:hypothetical protein|nr:DUF3987 domain-containing protein [Chromatiaceae bacterium]